MLTLERLSDLDIDVPPNIIHPTGSWLISYQELATYYEQAERMPYVVETNDTLSTHRVNHLLEPPTLGLCDT